MKTLVHLDWQAIFIPTGAVAEITLRDTLVYVFLVCCLRFLPRETGVIGISDLLVMVLIADAAQNAMSSDYKSVTDGAILVATIIGWNYLLDWAGYRLPWFQRFLRPALVLLVKDGRLLRRNLQRELITEAELMSQLRQHGVDNVAQVQKAYIEGDGRSSVIAGESSPTNAPGAEPGVR
jgi:uncharacterized membrane protein YcaP (DUF421 family)